MCIFCVCVSAYACSCVLMLLEKLYVTSYAQKSDFSVRTCTVPGSTGVVCRGHARMGYVNIGRAQLHRAGEAQHIGQRSTGWSADL